MHVKNTTGVDLFVSALGEYVEAGETVEVEAEVGARLVDQGWTSAVQAAAKKRARAQKKTPDEPAEPDTTPADVPAADQEN